MTFSQAWPTCIAAAWQTLQHANCASGTLEHILSHCPKALEEGRYRGRHDQVLRSLADTIITAIRNSKNQHAPKQSIIFIKAWENAHHQPSSSEGLLAALDWQLKFPENIRCTPLHPDMVFTLESTQRVAPGKTGLKKPTSTKVQSYRVLEKWLESQLCAS